jgi:endonuclease-3 related protein
MGTPTRRDPLDKHPSLKEIYQILFCAFGPQHWWPAQTPFEVMVGAILVQNTNWKNTERAIQNLKAKKLLTPLKLRNVPVKVLSQAIKPAGYFNIKAKRLKNFITFLFTAYGGSLKKMKARNGEMLRRELLSVNGIGEETADSILLYALDKPFFVVDAYTKRIFSRHGFLKGKLEYGRVQKFFTQNLPRKIKLYNEYHALIVRLAKDFCRTKPLCEKCPVGFLCAYQKRRKNVLYNIRCPYQGYYFFMGGCHSDHDHLAAK